MQVSGAVTNADAGFGEWALSDGSGELRVDDAGFDAIDAGLVAAGNTLQVTGAMDYTFGNYKVQPRTVADVLLSGCTNPSANYNSLATIDDGSCLVEGGECTLFVSEVAEGSLNNKYIELYNPTSSPFSWTNTRLATAATGATMRMDPHPLTTSLIFGRLAFLLVTKWRRVERTSWHTLLQTPSFWMWRI